MHIDGQQVATFAIVAIAAVSVLRRMATQIANFSTSRKTVDCGGCDGCSAGHKKATVDAPLLQIQTHAPIRRKRTSTGGQ